MSARKADMDAGELAQLLAALAVLIKLLTQLVKVLRRQARADQDLYFDTED